MNKDAGKKGLRGLLLGGGRISSRFRNYNIMLLALAFFWMIMTMSVIFSNIINQVSADYAGHYAISSAEALSAHIAKEIALMAKAARSSAVIDWLTDEENEEKKNLAYEEMSGIIGELYTNNLYIGFKQSLHEYKIDRNYTVNGLKPPVGTKSFDILDKNDPEDSWYFDCIASGKEYILNIGIDHVLRKKRVWLDCNVVQDGVLLGVICTGLDFSNIAGELFANYHDVMRGFIVDADGVINMDSDLMNDDDFLSESRIEDEFTDPDLLTAVRSHLNNKEGYFETSSGPVVIQLSQGRYHQATISPIMLTDWSAVILYGPLSPLNMSLFLPAFTTMCVLLIAFAVTTSAISYRLIFSPLEKLIHSLARLKDNQNEPIYGLERGDEFGNLSNTIQDLFIKANRDALTGIYNRRYMENNLRNIMEFLSRSNGLLSVIMLDVDYFKKYNDTYGHEEGDACLRAVAHALTGGVTRAMDFVARYGGEEFIVVLPNTDEAGARAIAQKLLNNVRELNMPHANSAAAQYVTVSAGVTTGMVSYTQNWEDYVKRADEALYMSKQNGRNQYTYSPSITV